MEIFIKLCLLGSISVAATTGNVEPHIHARNAPRCTSSPSILSLSDLPYENYFYSDCNVAAQVVVTTPQPDSDLSLISPRLIIAWPAGNSGVGAFFAPEKDAKGSLSIALVNSTIGNPLGPVHFPATSNLNKNPSVGVQGVIRFNTSAVLNLSILGSIHTIRDYVEGGKTLYSEIQDAIEYSSNNGSVSLQRLWLDNVTTTNLKFQPFTTTGRVQLSEKNMVFDAGDYLFSTDINFQQLTALKPASLLNSSSASLATIKPEQVTALSFLSYTEKLLAGAWRFLTYFGRDTMISALLLEPVLSAGNGSAMEAAIGSVLERVNRTDGSVCHQETIGDYATWKNSQEHIISNAMICDYKMIDSDYYLPILMQRYFLQNPVGQKRTKYFFSTPAGTINAANINLTWGQLSLINAERIMSLSGPFFSNQTAENLIHLKDGQILGQWRDSPYGIGGGRIPYDVNTALVPAALRAIAALARSGLYPQEQGWGILADRYAQVWEDSTLDFFSVTIPKKQAQSLVKEYANSSFPGPDQASTIDNDVLFHALALDGYDNETKVQIMNTDDCFRHFLLNTTQDAQLSSFLNQTATNIRRTFPAGLMTDAGMVVANPAFGDNPFYSKYWTTGSYHGTVIWSWQLAMMAKGLELQMGRCKKERKGNGKRHASFAVPAFCDDTSIYNNVKIAYNDLWKSIEANSDQLSGEVWSWIFRDGEFEVTPLGELPVPPGSGGRTESDIRQLWSLSFLAVNRNEEYK